MFSVTFVTIPNFEREGASPFSSLWFLDVLRLNYSKKYFKKVLTNAVLCGIIYS